jgi:hypothetical protein
MPSPRPLKNLPFSSALTLPAFLRPSTRVARSPAAERGRSTHERGDELQMLVGFADLKYWSTPPDFPHASGYDHSALTMQVVGHRESRVSTDGEWWLQDVPRVWLVSGRQSSATVRFPSISICRARDFQGVLGGEARIKSSFLLPDRQS